RRSASTNNAQPEPSRRSALFNRADVATSSPSVALSRSGPRKRAVRWNEPSLFNTTPSPTRPAHGNQSASSAGRRRYSARDIMAATRPAVRDASGAARTPHGQRMTDQPQREADQPQLQAQPDGSGERAVGDCHRARRATEQNRLSQRAMQRHLETRCDCAHATSAPPEKEKNDRKNED